MSARDVFAEVPMSAKDERDLLNDRLEHLCVQFERAHDRAGQIRLGHEIREVLEQLLPVANDDLHAKVIRLMLATWPV